VRLLDAVRARLESESVPYALIGATAMSMHGVARSTLDFDVLAVDVRVLDAAFWGDLAPHADVRRGDADDPLAGAVRFRRADAYPVDVVVGRHAWQEGILARAERLPLGSGRVAVATAADIVLLKLYAGGAQDSWDIEQLIAARPECAEEVEARLSELPPEAVARWRSRRPRRP
jgi:hypothetical protein